MRGRPVRADLTSPAAVNKALTQELSGLKIGSYSDTFTFHLGLTKRPPLSTNDRQVASAFGVTRQAVANNPVIYEVLSRYYKGLADTINANLPKGAQPYEAWQLQALGWVQERKLKGNPSSDDLLMALEGIRTDLRAAGITLGPDGVFTREVLSNPDIDPVLTKTLKEFLQRRTGTVETGTVLTPEGLAAANIRERALLAGNSAVVAEYDEIMGRSLTGFIKRGIQGSVKKTKRGHAAMVDGRSVGVFKTTAEARARINEIKVARGGVSSADIVVAAILNKSAKTSGLTRMEIGRGSFQGVISLNMRLPFPSGMTELQRQAALAMMGRGLKQKAMAASRFTAVKATAPVAEGATRTYTIFFRGARDLDPALQERILANLPDGHDINIESLANGVSIDINPRFTDDGPVGITLQEVRATLSAAGVKRGTAHIAPADHVSDYIEAAEFDNILARHRREIFNAEAERIKDAFKGDASAARRYLRGDDDAGRGLSAANRRRGEAGRDRYRGHLDRLSAAAFEVGERHRALGRDLEPFVKKHGTPGAVPPDGGAEFFKSTGGAPPSGQAADAAARAQTPAGQLELFAARDLLQTTAALQTDQEGRTLIARWVAGQRKEGGPDVPLTPTETARLADILSNKLLVFEAKTDPGARGYVASQSFPGAETKLTLGFSDVLDEVRVEKFLKFKAENPSISSGIGEFDKKVVYFLQPDEFIDFVARSFPVYNTISHETGHLIDLRAIIKPGTAKGKLADEPSPGELRTGRQLAEAKGSFPLSRSIAASEDLKRILKIDETVVEQMIMISRNRRPWLWDDEALWKGAQEASSGGSFVDDAQNLIDEVFSGGKAAQKRGFLEEMGAYRHSYRELMAELPK